LPPKTTPNPNNSTSGTTAVTSEQDFFSSVIPSLEPKYIAAIVASVGGALLVVLIGAICWWWKRRMAVKPTDSVHADAVTPIKKPSAAVAASLVISNTPIQQQRLSAMRGPAQHAHLPIPDSPMAKARHWQGESPPPADPPPPNHAVLAPTQNTANVWHGSPQILRMTSPSLPPINVVPSPMNIQQGSPQMMTSTPLIPINVVPSPMNIQQGSPQMMTSTPLIPINVVPSPMNIQQGSPLILTQPMASGLSPRANLILVQISNNLDVQQEGQLISPMPAHLATPNLIPGLELPRRNV
jgi:hypothetical protein